MLQQDVPSDFVIATGIQRSVRDFVTAAATKLDMPITFEGDSDHEIGKDATGRIIVVVDPSYFRPAEVESLLGDASRARARLGWQPRTDFDALVREMVEADLEIAKAERQLT